MTIRDIPTEVVLGPSEGMPKECAVNLDHVLTVSRAKIGGVITVLDTDVMTAVRGALLFALGFRA